MATSAGRRRCGGGRADGGDPDQWQSARNGDVGVTSLAADDLPYAHRPPPQPPPPPATAAMTDGRRGVAVCAGDGVSPSVWEGGGGEKRRGFRDPSPPLLPRSSPRHPPHTTSPPSETLRRDVPTSNNVVLDFTRYNTK